MTSFPFFVHYRLFKKKYLVVQFIIGTEVSMKIALTNTFIRIWSNYTATVIIYNIWPFGLLSLEICIR